MLTKGRRFRVTTDLPLTVMTHWRAPYTGGYESVLEAGETIEVASDQAPGATAIYCVPVDYARLEQRFVSRWERWQFWVYGGYSLVVDVAALAAHCEPLDA